MFYRLKIGLIEKYTQNYNVLIARINFFDQPVKNDLRIYDNIRKIATGQGDDYPIDYLLDYPYFKKYYKLIATDLSKQQKLDADPKAIQKVNFTGSLNNNATIFFIFEEAKETVLNFSKGTKNDFILF